MICCFFSSFKTFAMLREATDPPAAVNVLDVSSESMAAFQVFLYGRFWVFTEGYSCLCDGPRTAPAPPDHAGYYSKQVLDENVDKPAAHMSKKRSRCTDIRETRKGQFPLTGLYTL